MNNNEKLASFGEPEAPVSFIETIPVTEGVKCDTYSFDDDPLSKDLAIVTVAPGAKTPLQRVMSGVTTTEGFVSGRGTLIVKAPDGQEARFPFDDQDPSGIAEVLVQVGQTMRWTADPDSELVFYEVCEPPYKDGRFQDLPD